MESSWLGLDDFFSSSSRLSNRRSRTRVSFDSADRADIGIDGINIDFGPSNIDLDTSALRSSILREFDSFPRKSRSKLGKTSAFSAQSSKEDRKEDVTENPKANAEYESTRELRLKLQNCQEENIKLQAVITDLTQVNKRWQKYNNDRQIYVQKLLNTIQDQQEQLNLIGERSVSKTPTPSSGSDTEIERLRNAEQRLKEQVSILEFQVKAHRDDWEAELNEKKQALKDKDMLEQKIAKLLSPPSELNERRLELFCQNCGQVTEFDTAPPPRSRMYRTAIHLPCTSSHHSSSTSISTAGDKLVFDGIEVDPLEQDLGETDKALNVNDKETSYSRSSTVPLACVSVTQMAPSSPATTSHSSTSSLGDWAAISNPVTVKTFMQIPIAKSSSVPEGRKSKFPELPRSSLDCFKPTHNPPLTVINSAEQYDGVETFSGENVICLRCGEVFPPNMHLKFLNHFPKCQSNRTHKNTCGTDSKV